MSEYDENFTPCVKSPADSKYNVRMDALDPPNQTTFKSLHNLIAHIANPDKQLNGKHYASDYRIAVLNNSITYDAIFSDNLVLFACLLVIHTRNTI